VCFPAAINAADVLHAFFYQKTHMEEVQLEKTKNAIRQVFIDTGITPFEDGSWNQYIRNGLPTTGKALLQTTLCRTF